MKSFLLASGGAAFVALGVLSAVHPAQAVGLYGAYSYKPGTGTAYNTTRVGTINATTGQFTQLSNSDVGFYLTDLAVRANPTTPSTDELFGIGGTTAGSQTFISISPTTGVGSNLGTITGASEILTGLGFASISGTSTLYAIGGGTGTATDSAGLYTINTSTRAATQIATISGLRSSGDIVYDSANNRFFATSLAAGAAQGGQGTSNDRVLCFTPTGGVCAGETTQVIGSTGVANSMTGLTIENGNLYGYNGYQPAGAGVQSNIGRYLIDADTGVASNRQTIAYNGTVPGNNNGSNSGYFSGTANDPNASVPEPLTVLGSGLAVCFGALMKVQHSRKLKKT